MQRVVVSAYHPLVLKCIINTLNEKSSGCEIVGQARSAKGLLALLKSYRPDVAVIDLAVNWNSGLDLLAEIHRIEPGIELHFISTHPIDDSPRQFMEKHSPKNRYVYIKRENLVPFL